MIVTLFTWQERPCKVIFISRACRLPIATSNLGLKAAVIAYDYIVVETSMHHFLVIY